MTTFREGLYTIDLGKGSVDVYGQLHVVGGVLAVIAPNGQLIHAYAPGAWREVWPKATA